MPSRILRDGMLDSEGILSLPVEARWLFVAILLSADDYGLFEATPFRLAKRADVKREHLPHLLSLLADAELVRLYTPNPGVPRMFGIVPKFGARLRGYRPKHPIPARSLWPKDDPGIFNVFNNLTAEKTGGRQTPTDYGAPPSDRGRKNENGKEKLDQLDLEHSDPTGLHALVVEPEVSTTFPACPTEQIVALWHEHCAPPLATVGVLNAPRRKAIAARWREVCSASAFDLEHGLEWFAWLFRERVAASPWLMGRVPKRDGDPFRCSFDWVMGPSNFAKVVDGNYSNRKGQR